MTTILTSLRRLERKISERTERFDCGSIYAGDALEAYPDWSKPDCIIADGPYGLGKFPGEPKSPDSLGEWYAPHSAAWARHAKPSTTLWFWNSEIGWANAHAALALHGWHYEETIIWDKGIAHIAGNVNSKTIRGVPVVTEIAVRYSRKLLLQSAKGDQIPAKQWLREEWQRSGLPMSQSNAATGTANAATRKYLTQCDMWYFPPGEAVAAMATWCLHHGRKTDRPYFSLDGRTSISASAWNELRAKWTHQHGVTNVWQAPPVHNGERLKIGSAYLHANQKPLSLLTKQILASTDPGDVIWEPFGGLCSATVAAIRNDRMAHTAEINDKFYKAALGRIQSELALHRRKVA